MLLAAARSYQVKLLFGIALIIVGTVVALAGPPIGWRTDGTGSYPQAQPPLEWSTTKNVVWCTPMPGYGVSHPVLLGKRIFICSEPATLLCLNVEDGKILWQKTSSYSELELDAEVRERLAKELEETQQLTKKQAAVRQDMDKLRKSLMEDKATSQEIEAKLKPFNQQINEIEKDKLKLTLAVRYTQPQTHSVAGYSAATPVTDGKQVFVVYGNGLVACYDLEGDRKWLKLVEHSNASFAHSGSPIHVADKLVVHFTDLVALDPKSGDEAWRLKLPTAHGTSLVTRIGDDDVIFTPKGALVRAKDGKLLAEGLGSCGSNSPIIHDNTVYYVNGQAIAVPVPETIADTTKLKSAWKARVKGGGYWFSSPVVHDGLFYCVSDKGEFTVLDAKVGKSVYEKQLDLKSDVYPSISIAGDRLYVSSDDGKTIVLALGREYKELAVNKLESFRSSLVFEGKRMYVRTEKKLYCIGE